MSNQARLRLQDGPSITVLNRWFDAVPVYTVKREGTVLTLTTDKLELTYDADERLA
jgi:hypothetical protein